MCGLPALCGPGNGPLDTLVLPGAVSPEPTPTWVGRTQTAEHRSMQRDDVRTAGLALRTLLTLPRQKPLPPPPGTTHVLPGRVWVPWLCPSWHRAQRAGTAGAPAELRSLVSSFCHFWSPWTMTARAASQLCIQGSNLHSCPVAGLSAHCTDGKTNQNWPKPPRVSGSQEMASA